MTSGLLETQTRHEEGTANIDAVGVTGKFSVPGKWHICPRISPKGAPQERNYGWSMKKLALDYGCTAPIPRSDCPKLGMRAAVDTGKVHAHEVYVFFSRVRSFAPAY